MKVNNGGGESGKSMGLDMGWEFRKEFPEEVTFTPKWDKQDGVGEAKKAGEGIGKAYQDWGNSGESFQEARIWKFCSNREKAVLLSPQAWGAGPGGPVRMCIQKVF